MEPKEKLTNVEQDRRIQELAPQKNVGPWQGACRKFIRNRMAVISLFFLLFLSMTALFADQIATHDPSRIELLETKAGISLEHLLGTDHLGRDVFSRLVYGTRISLAIGFLTMFSTLCIGVLLGAVSGYFGGWVDQLIMRMTDLMLILPSILLILTLMLIFQEVTIPIFILIIALISWPGFTRMIRGTFLTLKEQDFILSARAIGCSDLRIIFRHILPNAAGPIIVNATLGMATMIIIESALSFIGFGISPDYAPTWGNMLLAARNLTTLESYWWMWVPPGMAIVLTCLAINFIGDGLRDALDPKSSR